MGCKKCFLFVFKFLCFKFFFFYNSFLTFAKHYKIGGFSIFMVLVVEREEKGKEMIAGISGFSFFLQKWPFRDVYLFSRNWFGPPPKKKLIDKLKKLILWYFGVFVVFCSSCFCFFVFLFSFCFLWV